MNGQDYLLAASRLETAEGLDSWTALMRVLLARLRELEIPPQVQPSLGQAERHWAGFGGDLLEAKVATWRYIEIGHAPGAELETTEGRAARAVLCVLEPEGDSEARSMTAEWFSAMVDDR